MSRSPTPTTTASLWLALRRLADEGERHAPEEAEDLRRACDRHLGARRAGEEEEGVGSARPSIPPELVRH